MASSYPSSPSRRKLALVIGNNNYSRQESKLRHCINDASDLSDLLKSIHFNVTTHFDLTNVEMVSNINAFKKTIIDGDLVLFYFSGHGYQVQDKNYLMPVDDDKIETEDDIQDYAVCVETTIDRLAKTNRSHVTMFILDCCRKYWPKNMPKTKANTEGKGLHSMEPPSGTFIQFACGPNRTASDGLENERNGLFTKHLLRHIANPNTEIALVCRGIAYDVFKESNGIQKPLSIDGVLQGGHIYLNESNEIKPVTKGQPNFETSDVPTLLKIQKLQSTENDTTKQPTTTEKSNENAKSGTSSFYNACRDNNIRLVEQYLRTMSLEEINKIEPNGSTALHVAAYRGHEMIVELLLEKGACYTTRNKYKNTPFDEAKNDKIKQMIRSRRNAVRFVGESIEWIIVTNNADYQAYEYSKNLEIYGKDPHIDQLIIYIKKNCLEKDLKDINGIDNIKTYFDKAINKKDPIYLLQAYTSDTDFYSKLNIHLAQLQLERLTNKENVSYAYYIGIIRFHRKFETFSYIGTTFRGMIINNDTLQQYKIGTRILTKTFLSTSKQLNVASQFIGNNRDNDDQFMSTIICVYEIRYRRTALDIGHISVVPDEQEVLILPYSTFKIIDIKRNRFDSPGVEIKLKECDPW